VDSSSIQIADSEIAGATLVDGEFRLYFSRALIVKTMTGSVERTLWWQAGELVIGGVETASGLPGAAQSASCDHGDLDANEYTYRNMIPVPLASRGTIRLELHVRERDEPLIVTGSTLRLELHATPKYIEHLRPSA
jgi:hypothetical protein